MRVHLVNPSFLSFGTGVMTPRWMYVLASAPLPEGADLCLHDETLEPWDPAVVLPGDVVGISLHTGNALRGYQLGCAARKRGAWVVYGGIHATLFVEEARGHGGAHAVVTGDGEGVWPSVLKDCQDGAPRPLYAGGHVPPEVLGHARWDLLPKNRYLWATVQTVRGCPKHCSFCSVWRTDGQRPRQRAADAVLEELVDLRRRGFRFIVLADDNFYPVSLADLRHAARRSDPAHRAHLAQLRAERLAMLRRLALLPPDMVFFTQITMEAAEDPEFLDAMRRARIKGVLVGVESITAGGLKDVYKDFNAAGEELEERLLAFSRHGVHVLGSFIFGLPSDTRETFAATAALADRARLAFAQFVPLTPLPGTIDFQRWEAATRADPAPLAGPPLTRYWLIPPHSRPRVNCHHPLLSSEDIRRGTQLAWDRFYAWRAVWRRSRLAPNWKARAAFVLISKLYRQMYAGTGIAADSARAHRAALWSRCLGRACRRLFAARPMPAMTLAEEAPEPLPVNSP